VDPRLISVSGPSRLSAAMASGRTARLLPKPTWWDSFLFLALMSGPPKFRDRDLMALRQFGRGTLADVRAIVPPPAGAGP